MTDWNYYYEGQDPLYGFEMWTKHELVEQLRKSLKNWPSLNMNTTRTKCGICLSEREEHNGILICQNCDAADLNGEWRGHTGICIVCSLGVGGHEAS